MSLSRCAQAGESYLTSIFIKDSFKPIPQGSYLVNVSRVCLQLDSLQLMSVKAPPPMNCGYFP